MIARHDVRVTSRSPQRGPWTPEEDQELVHGPGTVLDRAVRLRRPYLACTHRLARLREAGTNTLD